MVSLPPLSFSDLLKSEFALCVKSVPACFWLCFVACLFFWGGGGGDFCVSYWVLELLSVTSRLAFCVFFFSLLYERALFLAEAADPFGSQVSLSDMVAFWDESGFSLSPVSRSDLMISLATWSPFEMSLGFDWSFDLFRSKDLLSNVVTLCDESKFRLVL